MKTIFAGQSKLRLIIDTGCDLRRVTGARLAYRKPDNTLGCADCGVLNEDEGSLFCDVEEPSFLDMSGWWAMWPELVFDDGRSAFGKAARVFVGEKGR